MIGGVIFLFFLMLIFDFSDGLFFLLLLCFFKKNNNLVFFLVGLVSRGLSIYPIFIGGAVNVFLFIYELVNFIMLRKFLIPVVIMICAIVWWLMPSYSDEDKGYYIAMFCTMTHDGYDNSPKEMKQVIEGSNSGYALQRIHFQSGLAENLQSVWQGLSTDQQLQARKEVISCRRIMSEKILPGQIVQ